MPARETPPKATPPKERQAPYPAEKARGGEIILRTRMRRMIFIGGLVAAVVLALLLSWFA